jgi:hypothetical protein
MSTSAVPFPAPRVPNALTGPQRVIAEFDRAMLHREQVEALVDTALNTIREILADPTASPSVRLKAALAILDFASTPPPEPPSCIVDFWEFPKSLHKDAQIGSGTHRREQPKMGRNEDCRCGSGLKFKRCCLNKLPQPTMPGVTEKS